MAVVGGEESNMNLNDYIHGDAGVEAADNDDNCLFVMNLFDDVGGDESFHYYLLYYCCCYYY